MTDPLMPQTRQVLAKVFVERMAQEARYGEANKKTQSGTGPETRWLLPYTTDSAEQIQKELRADYEAFEDEAPVTWAHLVREELAEAFELEADDPRLVDELIQVAALCVSWVERLLARPEGTLFMDNERTDKEAQK